MSTPMPAVIETERLPHFLTLTQVAELLGIGRTTAYDAARRGEIPTVRIGRRLRVPRHALLTLGQPQAAIPDDAA